MIEPYYDEGDIQIYLGDCLCVMPYLPKVDMILADPPYGKTAWEWDSIIPFEPMWKELKGLIKNNRAIVISASQPFTSMLVMSNLEMFKYEWIWEKDKPSNFALCNIQPLKYHENICVFGKGKIKYIPQKWVGFKPVNKSAKYGRTKSEITKNSLIDNKQAGGNIDRFPKSKVFFNSAKEHYHPTQKPVKLMEYLIKTYTNNGDLILDFAMGSGTTLVAAKELGRKAIGIEIEEKYCEIAVRRLQQEVFKWPK